MEIVVGGTTQHHHRKIDQNFGEEDEETLGFLEDSMFTNVF